MVIWATNGIRTKNMDNPDIPQDTKDYVLAIMIIAVVTSTFVVRLVTYRVVKSPLRRRFMKAYLGPR